MRENPVAHLVRQIERLRDPERLLVVPETPPEPFLERVVERILARVAEGRVSRVMPESDRLDEVFVQRKGASDHREMAVVSSVWVIRVR